MHRENKAGFTYHLNGFLKEMTQKKKGTANKSLRKEMVIDILFTYEGFEILIFFYLLPPF